MLFRVSRFRSMAVKPARTPAQPVESRVPQPKANVVLTKPSTLIETPIEWNGDGLLPGESISVIGVLPPRLQFLRIVKLLRLWLSLFAGRARGS